MSARVHTVGQALLGLIGPIIWAAHFFSLYLAEALLCVSADAGVQLAGAALTLAAIAALLYARSRAAGSPWASLIRPLIDLSLIAVIWTAIPLLTLRACTPAGA